MLIGWLFYTPAKLGVFSLTPSPQSHTPRCPDSPRPVRERDPPHPELSHHSILPPPWDESNHLFLHLWQTISPSTIHPLFWANVCVCQSPCGPGLRPCGVPPVWFLCVTLGRVTERGWSDSAKSHPRCSSVFTCTLRQIHVQHLYIAHSHQHQGLNRLAITEMWQLD